MITQCAIPPKYDFSLPSELQGFVFLHGRLFEGGQEITLLVPLIFFSSFDTVLGCFQCSRVDLVSRSVLSTCNLTCHERAAFRKNFSPNQFFFSSRIISNSAAEQNSRTCSGCVSGINISLNHLAVTWMHVRRARCGLNTGDGAEENFSIGELDIHSECKKSKKTKNTRGPKKKRAFNPNEVILQNLEADVCRAGNI